MVKVYQLDDNTNLFDYGHFLVKSPDDRKDPYNETQKFIGRITKGTTKKSKTIFYHHHNGDMCLSVRGGSGDRDWDRYFF